MYSSKVEEPRYGGLVVGGGLTFDFVLLQAEDELIVALVVKNFSVPSTFPFSWLRSTSRIFSSDTPFALPLISLSFDLMPLFSSPFASPLSASHCLPSPAAKPPDSRARWRTSTAAPSACCLTPDRRQGARGPKEPPAQDPRPGPYDTPDTPH